MLLGERLKALRKKRGLSQEQVSEKLNIARGTYAHYEINKRRPDGNTLKDIAEFYGVSTDYLLGHDLAVEQPSNLIPIGTTRHFPIVAEIPCGEPILTEQRIIGNFPVDTSFVNLNGGDYVWLKAKGDSMINANILDGSLVLIRLQPEVENGEIAAVSVDNENATLKKVFLQDDIVVLKPENDTLAPWSYERRRIRIVGKVVLIATFLS